MHLIIGAYLFLGGIYSAWSLKWTKKNFEQFKDYFWHVVLTTFLWPLFAFKDGILKLYDMVFG